MLENDVSMMTDSYVKNIVSNFMLLTYVLDIADGDYNYGTLTFNDEHVILFVEKFADYQFVDEAAFSLDDRMLLRKIFLGKR